MDFREIEKKWQKNWEEEGRYKAIDFDSKPKYYILVEFPYPSGAGLHVGHTPNQIAMDIIARKKRAQGYNVLYPIGWDAFGLPTENYAIKHGVSPVEATKKNIDNFKRQIKSLGISFDWSREINTTDENYYKWTQWIFLQFFKKGLAYKATVNINWCPNCKIGLSNEESEGGVCERCGTPTVQKPKTQWMLKMSAYAEKLLQGLDETRFWDNIKTMQRNWIGKSEGTLLHCKLETGDKFDIFTTCIETIYGITYFVLAPEHPLVEKLKDKIENYDEVLRYIEKTQRKTEFERTQLVKEKSGCVLKGINAINPINGKSVPVFISDYVLANYGTGAVMAVPAHDERDYDFAKLFDLPMIEVISGGDIKERAFEKGEYLGKGCRLINSDKFDGLTVEEAKEALNKYLEEQKLGQKIATYKMRDWVFSRQRYWGEPVPLVYCEKCGWVAVPEEELPVTLPKVEKYHPTDDGESPLSRIESWVNTTCPHCGGKAKRETDVMPNWAGSSWYWLRYMDPHNDKAFADFDKMKYWGKVDIYNGGGEHVTRHLLYARFWHRFLYDNGLVPYSEPFDRRVQQGIILAADGSKMSKSAGNTVDPMIYVEKYGADVARLGQMFMGDYVEAKPWREDTMKPCEKLLKRIVALADKVTKSESQENKNILAQSIKTIDEDIEGLKFNTAISQLMVLTTTLEKASVVTDEDYKVLLKLLNPFAPHISEEIWSQKGYAGRIDEGWPKFNEEDLKVSIAEIAVQVNSKIIARTNIDTSLSKEQIIENLKTDEKVAQALSNKEIVKAIYVPNRIVNFIVK